MNNTSQLTLFDKHRLARQAKVVLAYFESRRGEWLTLADIKSATGAPEASASARFRDLRAAGFPMQRKPGVNGLNWYRMAPEREVFP